MHPTKKPYGFGGIDQVAQFFGLPRREVQRRATSGEWPSYVIAGRRVFDIDELLQLLVKPSCDRCNQQQNTEGG